MKRIKECYEVSINGEQKLIQVIRNEKKEERNEDGTLNVENWCGIIDKIMKKYLNADNWVFTLNDERKKTNIKLTI